MTFDREPPRVDADSIRDEEIAQMLAATNARRAAHGRPPLALADLRAAPDPELRGRGARVRRGPQRAPGRARPPPLDVEAEVERRLSGQDG